MQNEFVLMLTRKNNRERSVMKIMYDAGGCYFPSKQSLKV